MLNAIIVDDEVNARAVLKMHLKEVNHDVTVVGECDSALKALKMIKEHNPNLVFLDIEMSGGSGFDLLELLEEVNFHVIFITAYDNYAIKAFRFNAVDYLLKPLDLEELETAVGKAKTRIMSTQSSDYGTLIDSYRAQNFRKLAIPAKNGFVFEEISSLIYFKAEGSYTNVYVKGKDPILVSKPLKHYTDMLEPEGFYKPHRSYLINLNQVREFCRTDGGYLVMENGDMVVVAERKKEELLGILS